MAKKKSRTTRVDGRGVFRRVAPVDSSSMDNPMPLDGVTLIKGTPAPATPDKSAPVTRQPDGPFDGFPGPERDEAA